MHRLCLLGRIDLRDAQGHELQALLAQPKRLALVAYLCVGAAGSSCRRDKLLALLWPELDQERARKALNKAVHFVRHALGDEVLVSRTAEELAVNTSRLWCDAAAFDGAIDEKRFADALDLYRGDLLPGFFVDDAPEFEEWLDRERRRLRMSAARAARLLADEREREGNGTSAVTCARRAMELAEDDERVARHLLELLDRLGDRAGALQAYESFARRLVVEYDAEPAAETKALIGRIRARDAARAEAPRLDPHAGESLPAALLARGYEVEREIGRGGMATVYLAVDVKHGRRVAVKVLAPEVGALRLADRFAAEIRVTAKLEHPNILPLFDSGEAVGLLYYVMPYVEGESLRARLERDGQLAIDEAVEVVRTLAGALEYAHRHGVVHRDIKPENILLQAGQPLLADFGIALALSSAGGARITATGLSLGTPQYMSPEQAAGQLDVGPTSDIYSLGAVAYELLVGEPPFTGPNSQAVLARVMIEPPRPIHTVRDTVPAGVEAAILRALAKNAADRFRTAAGFAAALQGGMARSPGASLRYRLAAIRTPVMGGVLLGTLALIATIAVGAVRAWRPFAAILQGVASPTRPDNPKWILVADFDSPSDDRTLGAAVRELVSTVLDESKILATVPRDQLKSARRAAEVPDTARLTGEVARHLAYRSAVRAVVEGRVDRIGRGAYSIVVRAVGVKDGRILTAVNGSAGEADIIPTAERLARRIGAALAERDDQAPMTAPLGQVITPSFDAYRLYVQAFQPEALADGARPPILLREAVKLDPQFAAAWFALGMTLDASDPEHEAALTTAQRLPHRLTPVQRLTVDAMLARVDGDPARAVQLWDRVLQEDASSAEVYLFRGLVLRQLARYDEAVGSLKRAVELSPLAPDPSILNTLAITLAPLGRVDEARVAAGHLHGALRRDAEVHIALAEANWARAESLATAEEADPPWDVTGRRQAALTVAGCLAARGRIAAARQWLRRVPPGPFGSNPSFHIGTELREQLLAAAGARAPVSNGAAPGRDTTAADQLARGLWHAWRGDTAAAGRELRALRARSLPEEAPLLTGIALLDGWTFARGEQWRDVVRALAPLAWHGDQTFLPGSLLASRWLVADAYERLGRPDSAAAYFELLATPTRMHWVEQRSQGLVFSFAHRRLALLYSRMGKRARARRHWQIFLATFTQPDPEFVPLVQEARAALAGGG